MAIVTTKDNSRWVIRLSPSSCTWRPPHRPPSAATVATGSCLAAVSMRDSFVMSTRTQRRWVGLFMGAALSTLSSAAEWQTFRSCRILPNPANDGDSFHARCPDGEERIFRLYFVDAPETDASFPDRVVEQAKYFSITPEQVLEVGKAARDFTDEFLKEPFSVQTKLSTALGRSTAPRYYAIAASRDGVDVAAALVSNGLARVFGEGVSLPDGTSSERRWDSLRLAEAHAQRNGLGAWALAKEEEDASPVMVLQKDAMIHTDTDPPRPLQRVRVRERMIFLEGLGEEWVKVAYGANFKAIGRCRWMEVKTALPADVIAERKYLRMLRARAAAQETLLYQMRE